MLLDIIYLRRKYILKLKQTHSTKARIPNVVNRIPAAAIKEQAYDISDCSYQSTKTQYCQ